VKFKPIDLILLRKITLIWTILLTRLNDDSQIIVFNKQLFGIDPRKDNRSLQVSTLSRTNALRIGMILD
jgi:hypothetical protein